jgi:hypothetical protein
LIPNVFLAIASKRSFEKAKAQQLLNELKLEVFAHAQHEARAIAARYTARKLDRLLKAVTLDRTDPTKLVKSFNEELLKIDPATEKLDNAIRDARYEEVLQLYDQKGLIGLACRRVGISTPKELVRLVSRALLDDKEQDLRTSLASVLPAIPLPVHDA